MHTSLLITYILSSYVLLLPRALVPTQFPQAFQRSALIGATHTHVHFAKTVCEGGRGIREVKSIQSRWLLKAIVALATQRQPVEGLIRNARFTLVICYAVASQRSRPRSISAAAAFRLLVSCGSTRDLRKGTCVFVNSRTHT